VLGAGALMRVEVTRTGGFGGLLRPAAVLDTATLPPSEARRVEGLVEAADFFNLRTGPPGRGADRFTYQVTVLANHRQHTVVATEGAMNGALQELIEYVLSARRAEGLG
jgi:hypothetical protein